MAEYRFTETNIGKIYEGDPAPPVNADTTYYPAGTLLFGVEHRTVLHPETGGLYANGPTLHVFDAETRQEYLRFDIFPGLEHYHYIVPGQQNHLVGFDVMAHGDFLQWALDALRTRLPQLLETTGGHRLASALDAGAIEQGLTQAEVHLRRICVPDPTHGTRADVAAAS